ncbi:Transforming acidic coiled-coil-containing protein 3 [Quaeritorhiza haematococci]|nr:Transforming acidic coiled-coil-containing protein 3 [Quaeritorhiza haematococci]
MDATATETSITESFVAVLSPFPPSSLAATPAAVAHTGDLGGDPIASFALDQSPNVIPPPADAFIAQSVEASTGTYRTSVLSPRDANDQGTYQGFDMASPYQAPNSAKVLFQGLEVQVGTIRSPNVPDNNNIANFDVAETAPPVFESSDSTDEAVSCGRTSPTETFYSTTSSHVRDRDSISEMTEGMSAGNVGLHMSFSQESTSDQVQQPSATAAGALVQSPHPEPVEPSSDSRPPFLSTMPHSSSVQTFLSCGTDVELLSSEEAPFSLETASNISTSGSMSTLNILEDPQTSGDEPSSGPPPQQEHKLVLDDVVPHSTPRASRASNLSTRSVTAGEQGPKESQKPFARRDSIPQTQHSSETTQRKLSTPAVDVTTISDSPARVLSTPSVRRSTSTNDYLAEFDPLKKGDWMMSFETPAPNHVSSSAPLASSLQTPTANSTRSGGGTGGSGWSKTRSSLLSLGTPPLVVSLLDTQNEIATPTSILKYSEKDMDAARRNVRDQCDKEFELAQLEIQESNQERLRLMEENEKLKSTLQEWEVAMKNMIAEKDRDKERYKISLEKVLAEKERAEKSNDMMTRNYVQIKLKVDERKETELSLKRIIEALQNDVVVAKRAYDTLKVHAEEKLQSANVEIAKVRSTYDKEISALKAKLSRAELQISTLENTVETKTRENKELTKICDGLLAQIDAAT